MSFSSPLSSDGRNVQVCSDSPSREEEQAQEAADSSCSLPFCYLAERITNVWERCRFHPNNLFFPGYTLSQTPEIKAELDECRNSLIENFPTRRISVPVNSFIQDCNPRHLDALFFPVEEVDLELSPHLAEGLKTHYPNGRPTVILFSSNAGFYEESESLVDYYLCSGFNVFAFNYSGYGKSEGVPSKEAIDEDAEAILQYVKRFCPQENNIVLHGRSIGGAVASTLASRHPQVTVILDRSFANIQDILPNFFAKLKNGFLRRCASLFERSLIRLSESYCKYDNLKSLRNVRNVFVISGTSDEEMGTITLEKLQLFCREKTTLCIQRTFVLMEKDHMTSVLKARPNMKEFMWAFQTKQDWQEPDLVKFNQKVMLPIQKKLRSRPS